MLLTIVARPLMYLNYREHCPPCCVGLNVVWGCVYTVGYKENQIQLHTQHPMLHLTLYQRVDIARPQLQLLSILCRPKVKWDKSSKPIYTNFHDLNASLHIEPRRHKMKCSGNTIE